MVTKVVVKDRRLSPLHYLKDLKAFPNGKTFEFTPGVNIIVGENGCGKTTLLNLIKKYLLVGFTECSKGQFGYNKNSLYENVLKPESFYTGVDVYADYHKNTFRLSHAGEKENKQALETFEDFGAAFAQHSSSTGEGVLVALNSLFNYMFSTKAKLYFDYEQFKESDPYYYQYIQKHKVEDAANEFTILMDEPDRNLSLKNLETIKTILSFHKPNTQLIAVIHNPILIAALQDNKEINFIEMTKGYISEVNSQLKSLLQNIK